MTIIFDMIEKYGEENASVKAFWDQMNSMLFERLKKKEFDDVALLMRHGNVGFISSDNWTLIADILEGKYKRPTRTKQRYYYRDKLIYLKITELRVDKGVPTTEVFDSVSKLLPAGMAIGPDTARDIYYREICRHENDEELIECVDFMKEIVEKRDEITLAPESIVHIKTLVAGVYLSPEIVIEFRDSLPNEVGAMIRDKALFEIRQQGRILQQAFVDELMATQQKNVEIQLF